MYELSFAYPSSPLAKQVGKQKTGAYVLEHNGNHQAFDFLDDAARAAEQTGDRPGRWSVNHPLNLPALPMATAAISMTQIDMKNAALKIDGYFFPTPAEDVSRNTQPAVERARAECIANLRRQIEHIETLPAESFYSLTGRMTCGNQDGTSHA